MELKDDMNTSLVVEGPNGSWIVVTRENKQPNTTSMQCSQLHKGDRDRTQAHTLTQHPATPALAVPETSVSYTPIYGTHSPVVSQPLHAETGNIFETPKRSYLEAGRYATGKGGMSINKSEAAKKRASSFKATDTVGSKQYVSESSLLFSQQQLHAINQQFLPGANRAFTHSTPQQYIMGSKSASTIITQGGIPANMC